MANKTGTIYVVLREQQAGERYAMVGETEATSSTSAIRQIVLKLDPENRNGNYVAIPYRSFQVVPVAEKFVEPQLQIGAEPAPVAPKQREREVTGIAPLATGIDFPDDE